MAGKYSKSLMVALLLSSTAGVFYPLSAQDAEVPQQEVETSETDQQQSDQTDSQSADDQQAEAEQETSSADQKPAVQEVDDSRVTFFIGDRPKLQRQKGPSVGQPVSILPKPYVPVGSVALPVEETVQEATPSDAAQAGTNSGTEEGAVMAGEPSGGVAAPGSDAGNAVTSDEALLEGAALSSGGDNSQTEATMIAPRDPLAGEQLSTLDPSGVGVLDGTQAFPAVFWSDYARSDVIDYLHAYSAKNASPSLRDLLRRVALSPSMPAAPAGPDDVANYIKARLNLIRSVGDADGFARLIGALPADTDKTLFSNELSVASLLSGDLLEGCAVADTERRRDASPYWLKYLAFCEAARGSRMGVDFQLGVLEEVTSLPQTFYQLIEQVLVQAENPTAPSAPEGTVLAGPVEVTPLNAAMARLSQVAITSVSTDNVNPVAVPVFLALPTLGADAGANLVMLGLKGHNISLQTVADYIRSTDFDGSELMSLDMADTENDASDDTVEGDAYLPAAIEILAAAKTLALPEEDTGQTDLMPVVEALQAYARRTGSILEWNTIMALLVEGDNERFLSVDTRLMFALLRQDYSAASEYAQYLRTRVAGDNPDLDVQLVRAWPYIAILDTKSTEVSSSAYKVWQGQATSSIDTEMPVVLLEAFGRSVPESLWQHMEMIGKPGPKLAASTAQWRRLVQSARSGDRAATLAAALRLMASTGISNMSADTAGSVLQYLGRMGLEEEASQLAVEMMVAQGL
ncbi:hypothetical protein [Kordiimonas sediminis]|uniref:hypothetical protein n=1 Tax=Kordiimonas sediminis TaxID=1735581 RepID=UPI00174D57D2|nr:hypothetical protein [Kordiimonas sediminis]